MKEQKYKKRINKGKQKNLFKRKKLISNKGSATAETILIIAVVLVIIVTVFYPQIRSIINNTFVSISSWYSTALNNLGIT